MNPTQNQDNSDSESRPFGENFLADLFPDADQSRAWIASVAPAETGYVVTDKGREALAGSQRYDCCTGCGGPFAFGLSLHPICATCSAGEEQTAAEPVSSCPVDLVTETDDETTARVLRSAATYLERHGWIQGAYYDATSGVFSPPACLVGAIGMVCYGGPVEAPAQHFDDPGFLDFEAAVLHLDRYLLAENGSESYGFNDAKGRRVDDVTRVLRDAASRPVHELIDALKAIDQQNADAAALSAALVPGGVERCPSCGSSQRGIRLSVRVQGDLVDYCGDDWHGDSSGLVLSFDWSDVVDADGRPVPGRAEVCPTLDTAEVTNVVDCQFCGAPGGYPYCQNTYGGQMSCAEVVAADNAELASQDGGAEHCPTCGGTCSFDRRLTGGEDELAWPCTHEWHDEYRTVAPSDGDVR